MLPYDARVGPLWVRSVTLDGQLVGTSLLYSLSLPAAARRPWSLERVEIGATGALGEQLAVFIPASLSTRATGMSFRESRCSVTGSVTLLFIDTVSGPFSVWRAIELSAHSAAAHKPQGEGTRLQWPSREWPRHQLLALSSN